MVDAKAKPFGWSRQICTIICFKIEMESVKVGLPLETYKELLQFLSVEQCMAKAFLSHRFTDLVVGRVVEWEARRVGFHFVPLK